MRVPWIRVHSGLYDKPVVDRLARRVRISEHEAIGVLVTFWSGVAANAVNGFIRDASDAQLEKWAKWKRKRGAFAAWVRAEHIDPDGRVPEWDEYAGKLELIRAKDRQRKAAKNPSERNGKSSGIPAESVRNSAPARANGTERDETERDETRQNPKSKALREVPEWPPAATAFWTAEVGVVRQEKIHSAFGPLVDAHGWDAVRAALEVYCSLDEGPTGARKPEWFAENFQRWRTIAETPLVDQDGVLTDRGQRLGRRSA